jgi:hypothetical protein
MNLSALGVSVWILVLNVVLLIILCIQLVTHFLDSSDSFINYPSSVDPQAPITENPDIADANNNYAALLMFLKDNPSKSAKFIMDIKQKFFEESCQVKNNIDFNNIASFLEGPIFE